MSQRRLRVAQSNIVLWKVRPLLELVHQRQCQRNSPTQSFWCPLTGTDLLMGTHKPHWCPQPRFLLNSPHPQCLLSHWRWSAGGSTLANATQPELMIRPSLSTGCVVSRIVHLCYDAAFKFNAECAGCRLCFYFGLCDVTLCDGDKIHGVMVLKCKDFMFHCVFFNSRVWAR